MTEMNYHLINESKLQEIADLWDYCFEKKEEFFHQWYFNEYCLKQNQIVAGFDDEGRLANMVHLNPYRLSIRGKQTETMYLVGVATESVFRGRRLTRGLLELTLAILRAKGINSVLLMPEHAGVYLPYQFAFTYFRHRYNMPLSELNAPVPEDALRLERVNIGECKAVFADLYSRQMLAKHAFVCRGEREWNNFLTVFSQEKGEAVIAYLGNNPLGYMFYQRTGVAFRVHELIYLEHEVKWSFLHYAKQHVAQCQNFEWLAGEGDLSHLQFTNQKYAGCLQPFAMSRVINVAGVLADLKADGDLRGSFVLLVTDKLLKANNSLLSLNVENGVVEVKPAFELPDVEMDVAAFTQLFFGQFSLNELAAEGLATVCSKPAADLLAGLFPKCKNYLNEYY